VVLNPIGLRRFAFPPVQSPPHAYVDLGGAEGGRSRSLDWDCFGVEARGLGNALACDIERIWADPKKDLGSPARSIGL